MVVGTDIGVVHKQKQGTGLATELTDSTSDDYLMKYADAIARANAERAEAKKKILDEASTKIKEINPDFFFKHQNEISQSAQSLRDLGVNLLKQGKNPYSDEAFLKAQGELNAASKYSVQDKEMWARFQQDVQNVKDGQYDAASVSAMMDYFNMPLKDKMATQASPPMLVKATPSADLVPIYGKLAQNPLSLSDNGDYNPDAPASLEYAASVLSGDKKDEVLKSVTQEIQSKGQQYAAALASRAQQNGVSVPQQHIAEQARFYAKKRDPYNYQAVIKDALSMVRVTSYSRSGPSGGSKGINKAETMKSCREVATTIIESDPRSVEAIGNAEGVQRTTGMTDAAYKTAVKAKLAAKIYNMVPKDRESFATAAGVDKAKADESSKLFIGHIKSGDQTLANEAAGFLKQTKLSNGMIISNAQVDGRGDVIISLTPQSMYEDPFKGLDDAAVLLSLKSMLPQIDEARSEYNAKTGIYEIVLPKTASNTNELMNLHQQAMMQNKRTYTGIFTPSPVQTIEEANAQEFTPTQGKPVGVPQQPKPIQY